MKTFSRLSIVVLAALFSPLFSAAQTWELVWADEFDGSEVDTTKWSFQIGDGCPDLCGWGNGELQYYTADNTTVDGGTLKITALEETVGGREYTSARLRTLGKASWTYGRIETRAKMPRTIGYWPAIWMLPSDEVYGGWAASGEIDLLEVFGNDPGVVHGTIHFGGVSPQNTFVGGSSNVKGSFSRTFHEFAIEWVPGEIRWYLDGALYHTQNEWYSTEARFPAPFDQDFHLLMNVAIGGAGGTPDASSSFPQSMEIDYIRVYQSQNTDPVATLSAPTNGSILAPGSELAIAVSAEDADGAISRVEFYSGDAHIASDDEAPYELNVGAIPEGCYVIRGKAVDTLGGETWTEAASITVGSCTQAPYRLAPAAIPGRIEAEQYDLGGEGAAYHDLDSSNAGNADGNDYRMEEAVDIGYALGRDAGYFVRDFEAGEWLEYHVEVAASGPYTIDVRAGSEAGAAASILLDGLPIATGLEVPVTSTGTFATARVSDILLDEGAHTIRIQGDEGVFSLDYTTVLPYVEPPAAGTFIVEEFSDLTGAAWSYFGAASGTVTTGDGNDPFMRATFSGSGGTGGAFYGVMWKNLEDDAQIPFPADPWLSVRVRHSSTETTVVSYTLEITLREDTDGDGWSNGLEDSHRFDRAFTSDAFNDEWILVSVPLDSLTTDLLTGGNGILEGALDEVVLVVSKVTGPNPSAVVLDIDDITISTGPLNTGVTRAVPSTLTLYPPYPNPTTGPVNLMFDMDTAGETDIQVFDLLGRRVLAPLESFRTAGRHALSLNLEPFTPGIYFVRLKVSGATMTRRIVVAR